ncbi:MAG TPA: TusE/DsrC/DsvC family sulfur relay protein [candidate division Zixibacteria bacterium]
MPVIEVAGKKIELDDEGFIVNYDDWNEKVACALADKQGVSKTCPLTKEKMEILKFMREYYKKFNAFAIPRAVCKNIHQPKDCTWEEFPDPLTAYKIAGLPKPVAYGELYDSITKYFK